MNNNNDLSNPTNPHPRSGAQGGSLRSTRQRILLGAGLATLIGLGAVGVGSANGSSPTAIAHRPTNIEVSADERGAASTDLGETTLQELAEELSDLGLTIRIEPATDGSGGGDLDAPEVELDDTDGDDAELDDGELIDPFEGLSDDEIDAMSDEEFFAAVEAAGWDVDDGSFDDGSFEEPEPLGSFDVDGDAIDISSASDDEVATQAKEIWDRFAELVPAEQRRMVSSFELNPEEAGGAYVYQSPSDPAKWVLGVSLGLGTDLDYVLIHEFGHLLTLSAEQVPPSVDGEADCDTYFTGEGCALSNSTINQFVAEFWPQAQRDEIQRLQDAEDHDGLEAFYAAHENDFVTDYATTNPGEDIAETFAEFVLKDRPTGDTIADQKVQLLWDDPAMVELRSEIRTNL